MALFVSVLGLSGLGAFALLGALLHVYSETVKATVRPIFLARQQIMWRCAAAFQVGDYAIHQRLGWDTPAYHHGNSEVRTMELLFGTALAVWLIWSTTGGLYLMFKEGEKGIAEDEDELDTESQD